MYTVYDPQNQKRNITLFAAEDQDDPKAKMLLLLGEVGGLDEYDLIEAARPLPQFFEK